MATVASSAAVSSPAAMPVNTFLFNSVSVLSHPLVSRALPAAGHTGAQMWRTCERPAETLCA